MPPKTQKEMLSELYDAFVGTSDKPGIAEHIRDMATWQAKHQELHDGWAALLKRCVFGTLGGIFAASLTVLAWWLKSSGRL